MLTEDAPGRAGEPTLSRVLHTKGSMVSELAHVLSESPAPVRENLLEACLSERADLLVTAKLGSFDLVPVAAPEGFDPTKVEHVVAAIGTGPHSDLAAEIADRIGATLEVTTELVTASLPENTDQAREHLRTLAAAHPDSAWRLLDGSDAEELLSSAPPGSLLVVGAPGGNWFQRQLFGPGAKLRAKAPAGVVVVRDAPRRVFHDYREPDTWVSPQLAATEAARVTNLAVIPVVDGGQLAGVVRRRALLGSAGTVAEVMESAPTILLTDSLESVAELEDFYDGSPVAVVDDEGRFAGVVGVRAESEGPPR